MKRRTIIRIVRRIARDAGTDLEFVREGANHEIWAIRGERIVVPRHNEINERLARGIIAAAEEAARHEQ